MNLKGCKGLEEVGSPVAELWRHAARDAIAGEFRGEDPSSRSGCSPWAGMTQCGQELRDVLSVQ
jgi:hypothetical protein